MKNTLARLRVLLNAAPTYLVAASIIVTIIADEVADKLPGDTSTMVTKIAGYAVALIGAATAIVRRVVPVLPEDRGLLTPPPKADPILIDPPEPGDDGQIDVPEAIVIAILVIVLVFVLSRLF